MPFDPQSGLVFHETLFSNAVRYSDFSRTSLETRRPNVGISRKGANSLRDVAMLTILRHLHLLKVEIIMALPRPITENIWVAIKARKLDSFPIWKIFAATGCLGRSSTRAWSIAPEKNLQHNFRYGIDQATSCTFAWLTNLTLQSQFSILDLLYVASMQNLVRLRLLVSANAGHPTGFSDRILRSWASDANLRGAFSRLESIFVDRHEAITDNSFQSLSSFPALQLVCVDRCGIGSLSNAERLRARWIDETGVFKQFVRHRNEEEIRGEDGWKATPHCFSTLIPDFVQYRRGKASEEDTQVPLLNATIGEGGARAQRASTSGTKLFCFERNWEYQPVAMEPNHSEPQKKRRKVKDSNSRTFDMMLLGMP